MELVLRIPKLNIEAQVLSYMEIAEKYATTVRSLGEVVMARAEMRERMLELFSGYAPKWKRIVLGLVEVHSPVLHGLLSDI